MRIFREEVLQTSIDYSTHLLLLEHVTFLAQDLWHKLKTLLSKHGHEVQQ